MVQRVPEWIDPTDEAATPIASLKADANKTFGRRFEIVSVRELARIKGTGDPYLN